METPKVSVIIANYNYARYLPAAIDSVLAQTVKGRVEIIVVDDGSTDDSKKILERYAGKVEAVFQANQGYAAAFNAGIARAKGAIVCLLDADDVYEPEKIRRVVEAFEKHPDAPIVQHFLQDTDAELRSLPQNFPKWPERATIREYLEGKAEYAATSGLSFRRETLQKITPIPTELRFLYADDYLTVRALLEGPGVNIPETLALHRVHGSNFCAGSYADAAKIAADFTMRRVYRDSIDRRLESKGLSISPRFKRLEDLELFRREILFHMHERRRLKAIGAWFGGIFRFALRGFGLFRVATCFLALISPSLYLRFYSSYARSKAIQGTRRRLRPS